MAETIVNDEQAAIMESESNKENIENNRPERSGEDATKVPMGEANAVDTLELAMEHLAVGKKNLLISDPNAAVASLALACEQLGKHYGETAFECGEAYFYYGKALLELVRHETGVLNIDGDAGNETEDNEAEAEADGNEVEGNEADGNTAVDNEVEDKEAKVNQAEGNEAESSEAEGNEAEGNEAERNEADVSTAEEKEGEDVSNPQLAWEMLELAKTILVKHAESIQVTSSQDEKEAEDKAKLKNSVENRISDTFQTLGELSIENENYSQAIEDLETSLQRRQDMMPEDSRCIAETHYQLGIAKGFNMQFDDAVKSLEECINVLQLRVDRLNSKTESTDPSKAKDINYSRENETKEIEALIPEVKEKIADTNDMKRETFKTLGDKKSIEEGIAANLDAKVGECSSSGDSSKIASTISSDLIKKRPMADSNSPESKKMHIENSAANASVDNAAK